MATQSNGLKNNWVVLLIPSVLAVGGYFVMQDRVTINTTEIATIKTEVAALKLAQATASGIPGTLLRIETKQDAMTTDIERIKAKLDIQ